MGVAVRTAAAYLCRQAHINHEKWECVGTSFWAQSRSTAALSRLT
jgi:hypothetical protein